MITISNAISKIKWWKNTVCDFFLYILKAPCNVMLAVTWHPKQRYMQIKVLSQCAGFILRSMCKRRAMEYFATYKVSNSKRKATLIRFWHDDDVQLRGSETIFINKKQKYIYIVLVVNIIAERVPFLLKNNIRPKKINNFFFTIWKQKLNIFLNIFS